MDMDDNELHCQNVSIYKTLVVARVKFLRFSGATLEPSNSRFAPFFIFISTKRMHNSSIKM